MNDDIYSERVLKVFQKAAEHRKCRCGAFDNIECHTAKRLRKDFITVMNSRELARWGMTR